MSALLLTLLIVASCASTPVAGREAAEPIDTTTTTTTTTSTLAPTVDAAEPVVESSAAPVPLAFNGRAVPVAPTNVAETIDMLAAAEQQLRTDALADDWDDIGHQEQIIVRTLTRNPDWVEEVLMASTPDVSSVLSLHLRARSQLSSLHTAPPLENIPAWEIIDPEPLDVLVGHYKAAEDATGIRWQILAAINLIETGFGRIDGLSSAGAQGPMQFLPTTWEEVSEGGDIDDPGDAIGGAARYLVRRGGLEDIRAGLFGYNNSDNYVNAVLTYADLITLDERALRGIYNWEIYVGTNAGTLWLPVGFRAEEPVSALDWAEQNPWAETIRSQSN